MTVDEMINKLRGPAFLAASEAINAGMLTHQAAAAAVEATLCMVVEDVVTQMLGEMVELRDRIALLEADLAACQTVAGQRRVVLTPRCPACAAPWTEGHCDVCWASHGQEEAK